jgi:hypothetical protein
MPLDTCLSLPPDAGNNSAANSQFGCVYTPD